MITPSPGSSHAHSSGTARHRHSPWCVLLSLRRQPGQEASLSKRVSQYRGVSLSLSGTWIARARSPVPGKDALHCGCYSTELKAAAAHDAAEFLVHGR